MQRLRRADADLQRLARTTPLAALSADAVFRNTHLDAELKANLIQFPELVGLIITDVNGDVLYNIPSSFPSAWRATRCSRTGAHARCWRA